MSNWHDGNRLRLIAEFKKRPHLWLARHVDFSNQEKRREGITQITQFVNQFEEQPFTELEVRNQFKNMKDMYRRKVKRMRQMKAMDMPVEMPAWVYFQHLRFLDNSEEDLKPVVQEEDEDEDYSQETSLSSSSIMDDLLKSTLQQAEDEGNQLAARRRSKRRAEGPPAEVKAAKIVINEDKLSLNGKVMVNRNSVVEDMEDDFACFGKFIGSSLRKLSLNSPICALRMKKVINDLLFEAEFQELSNGFADEQLLAINARPEVNDEVDN
uniref:MADF domain-containing protein n=1 Tax=Ditylenchus dipsaci TaxID=166011 RepID=A0A915CZB6_9BILA